MNITKKDIALLIFSIYSIQNKLPSIKKRLAIFIRPLDAVRYIEFTYLNKFIKKNSLKKLSILDISSPHILAYVLSKNNKVTKTNLDLTKKEFIKENKNLSFSIEDATKLSFVDNSFDLTYSISVIEHIYNDYFIAIKEMIRVTKPNGYIYITFPVSNSHHEEWSDSKIYTNLYKKNNKSFFQYRFDEEDVKNILSFSENCGTAIIQKDIFWERRSGLYDLFSKKINVNNKKNIVFFIKNIIFNAWYGITMFSSKPSLDFSQAKNFGNIQIILKKN